MRRKVLITGAGGQLGKTLYLTLNNKFDVFPTARSITKFGICPAIKKLDITNRIEVDDVMRKIKPDVIINCAAFTDVDGCETNKNKAHMVNVDGLHNLIDASDRDIYIVQISSDYVFDGDTGPYAEDDSPYPINYYGNTKLQAENMIRGIRKKYLIIRTNVLYSEDLTFGSNFFAWVYNSLLNNKSIVLVNDQISNPTYVLHMAHAIFQCILLNANGIYHYGSDEYISRYDFALAIADYFKLDGNLITSISTEQLTQKISSYIARRPRHSGLKTLKIENEIGLSSYSTVYSLNLLKNTLVHS